MAKPDIFDEIIECLKTQALVSPDTYVSPEVRREFYTDIVKPPPVRQTPTPQCRREVTHASPPRLLRFLHRMFRRRLRLPHRPGRDRAR